MGFLEVLTLIFIVLKLTAYVDWSWFHVTSPLWAGYPILFAIFFTFAYVFSGSK